MSVCLRTYLLLTLFIFASIKVASAYQGVYTVGGINPDFPSLQVAIDSLESGGMSGPVALNIRTGYYPNTSVVIDSIPGNSIQNALYIQSELGDSSSVIIEGTVAMDGVISIRHSQYVSLSSITLINLAGNDYSSCLAISNSSVVADHLNLKLSPTINPFSSLSLIQLGHSEFNISFSEFKFKATIVTCNTDSIRMEYCTFDSSCGSSFYGSINYLELNNCRLMPHTGEYFTAAQIVLNACLISRKLTASLPQYSKFELTNCQIDSTLRFEANITTIKNNIGYGEFNSYFTGDSAFIFNNQLKGLNTLSSKWISMSGNIGGKYNLSRSGGIIENNYLNRLGILSCDSSVKILNNSIVDDLLISDCNTKPIYVLNNKSNLIDGSYSDSLIFSGNEMNNLDISYSTTPYVINNWIRKRISFSYNDQVFFYHNNSTATTFDAFYTNIIYCWNNNLFKGPGTYATQGNSNYNNYFPSGGYNEPNSVNVDPMYSDTFHLISRNPLLAGAGRSLSSIVAFDKDSLPRKLSPTIGAHEICYSSANHIDTVYSFCNLPTPLVLCNQSLNLNYLWSPSTGLSNIHSPAPIATITSPTLFVAVVSNSSSVIERDSIFLIPQPFIVAASADDTVNFCSQPAQLSATYNPLASYSWSPSIFLDDSLSDHPICSPDTNQTYIVMCTVPGCGTTSDTVNVVDLALPVGGFWPSSVNGNEITFNANYIQCTDTYIWNFGDSTGSTDQNPMHVYPDTGRYTVQLICCNRIGCDTFYYYLHIDSMSATANINVRNEISPGLTISPNPANDLLHIFIEPNSEEALLEAYNSNDQMIFRRKIKTSSQRTEFELNISDYADGIYLFRIISKSGVYCKKEIIHHNF